MIKSGTLTTFYCQQHGHNARKRDDMSAKENEEMEKLYSPSQWVRRMPVEQSVPHHVKVGASLNLYTIIVSLDSLQQVITATS